VDRNRNEDGSVMRINVALLAEGVDRNCRTSPSSYPRRKVALLAEGVDRN